MALLSRFFGRTASEGAAFAFGLATGPVLSPAVEEVRQAAWQQFPTRALEAREIAAIVAEDVEAEPWGQAEAARHGVNTDRFTALLGEARNAPGIGELFSMWRRGLISGGDFVHGLRKAKLETRWDGPLQGLHDVLLAPEVLANARQQGFMSPAETTAEAALQGVTADRAEVQFQLAGLPPGVAEGLAMLRRGIIDEATFRQIVREGHTKTKYTDALLQTRKVLLSAATAVRAHLKGHITADEMHARGALWGYSPDDMDLWYQAEGRPASVHQIHIGYARGGSLPGASGEQDAIRKAVAQSNIRPEYFDLLYAGRYSYPSAFVLRGLTQSGAITGADAEQVLLFSGWEPTLAGKVAAFWSGGTTATGGDSHVSKAQTQLWNTLHTSFKAGRADEATATQVLGTLGVDAAAVPQILALWTREHELERAGPSKADIRKQWRDTTLTTDEAVAALVDLGWSASQASAYLNE